jgi:hypothetical protein
MLDFDILDTVAGRQVYDEGLEKGRTEGLTNMREMLALNLTNRFGELSYDVTAAINSIKDVDYLKALFSKSFSYDNIDHFKKNLVTVNA